MYRPSSTCASRSPLRWSTRVGTLHRRQDAAHVDLAVHEDEVARGAGTRSRTRAGRPPAEEGGVGVRRHLAEVARGAPLALDLFGMGSPLCPGWRPRVVLVRVLPLRVGAVEDECPAALRIGGREEDRHRPSLRVAEERGALRARRVHHRPDVVHPRLEVGQAGGPVGEAGTTLVEADEPRERGEPLEEVRRPGLVPVVLEVRDEAGHEHEVARALPRDLVGDVDPTALGVASLGLHGPGPTAHHYFPSRNRSTAARGSSVAIESASQSRAWLIVPCQARSRQKLSCCFV